MTLVLSSVSLRTPEPKDVAQLYVYRNDADVIRTLVGVSSGYSIRDLELWVQSHQHNKNDRVWTIADREADRCLGHAGLYGIDHRIRSAEYGILIGDREWWKKGIATEVSRAILTYGFRELNLHRIEVAILSTNTGAMRVQRKFGFTEEVRRRDAHYRNGRYTDIVLLSLLESECVTKSA